MKTPKFFVVLCFIVFTVGSASAQLRVESRTQQLERQIKEAQLKRQLEDIRSGRSSTYEYNNSEPSNEHYTFKAEFHQCSNNGYHNTSYEAHCFDLYFRKNGTVTWNKRRYGKVKYNQNLNGTYYLVKATYHPYDIYITWDNGATMKGYVTYIGQTPELHIDNYVFTAQ